MPHGVLHVVEALAGSSGVYAIRPDREPELVLAGAGLVGLAFGASGDMVVASSDSVYSFPRPHDAARRRCWRWQRVAGLRTTRLMPRASVARLRVELIGAILVLPLQSRSYRVHDLGSAAAVASPVGVFDLRSGGSRRR